MDYHEPHEAAHIASGHHVRKRSYYARSEGYSEAQGESEAQTVESRNGSAQGPQADQSGVLGQRQSSTGPDLIMEAYSDDPLEVFAQNIRHNLAKDPNYYKHNKYKAYEIQQNLIFSKNLFYEWLNDPNRPTYRTAAYMAGAAGLAIGP
jgi:hypothetical protein